MRKICCVVLILLFPVIVFAQSAKDAYKALKKIEMQTETGIDLSSYRDALVDAKLEVDMFLETPESKNNSVLTKRLKQSLQVYEAANELWAAKISGYDGIITLVPKDMLVTNIKKYPFLKQNFKDDIENEEIYSRGQIYVATSEINRSVQSLWEEGSRLMKLTYKDLLSK